MISCPRQLDGRIEHLLAVNSVRIAVALGLPDSDGELVWWRSDWELRAHSRQRTIPDALFAVQWPELDAQVFALEVEYGTRAPRSFQSKLLRYSAASHRRGGIYGETNPIVLVVGQDSTWLARYRAAVSPLALSIHIAFADLSDVERTGASGAIWQPHASDERVSLRTLAKCCYRRDRTTPEIHGESSVCAAGAAHKSPSGTPTKLHADDNRLLTANEAVTPPSASGPGLRDPDAPTTRTRA